MKILLINGPNLNLLGQREPSLYGSLTMDNIFSRIKGKAQNEGVEIDSFQSNHEGELVDCIQKTFGIYDGILINAGAYTHTSIAIKDALLSVSLPYVELHLSNTQAREPFRHFSYLADNAVGIICGFGAMSYLLALDGLLDYLRNQKNN